MIIYTKLTAVIFTRVFDADENGFLSKDEFIKIVEHLYHLVPDSDKEHLTTPEMESTSLTD